MFTAADEECDIGPVDGGWVVVAAGWMELVISIVDTVAMFAVEVTLAVFTTTV